MFGIGGGELVFIMFIILMLFGSDKVPEMARTLGKAMAQLKNATNDIKSEIHKGVEGNGFDQKTLRDLTGSLTSEVNTFKANLLGDTTSLTEISNNFATQMNETKASIIGETSPEITSTTSSTITEIIPNTNPTTPNIATDTIAPIDKVQEEIEDAIGPIKRKK